LCYWRYHPTYHYTRKILKHFILIWIQECFLSCPICRGKHTPETEMSLCPHSASVGRRESSRSSSSTSSAKSLHQHLGQHFDDCFLGHYLLPTDLTEEQNYTTFFGKLPACVLGSCLTWKMESEVKWIEGKWSEVKWMTILGEMCVLS